LYFYFYSLRFKKSAFKKMSVSKYAKLLYQQQQHIMGISFSSADAAVDRAMEIRRLHDEVESLKDDNNQLRRDLMELLNGSRVRSRGASRGLGGGGGGGGGGAREEASQVSVARVDAFVEGLLADPETNLGFVPDFIERPAQRHMLLFLLKAIGHAVDTTTIEFMGHEIILQMRPIEREVVTGNGVNEEEECEEEAEDENFNADAIPL
jgi:hypothetical protein